MLDNIASFLAKYQLVSVVGVVLVGWILWQIRNFVLLFFLSYILMATLLPFITLLEKRHIPKFLGIITILFIVAGLIAYLFITFIPIIIFQTQLFLQHVPGYLVKLSSTVHIKVDIGILQSFLTSRIDMISSNIFSLIADTFTIFFTFMTFLIITFYLLLDYEKIQKAFLLLFPGGLRTGIVDTLSDINKTLGNWVRGQLVLSLFVGLLSWIVYLLTGLPFALPLAVFAGIMEVVPTLGPIIAFIPAVLLGFILSPLTGLFVAIGYIVVQMLEGNLLVPKIMQHSVGLHPLAVIVAVLIGAKFFGVFGTLLSVPFLAVFTIIYNRSLQKIS